MGKYTGEQFKTAVEKAVEKKGNRYFREISNVEFGEKYAIIKHKSFSGKANIFTRFELTDDDKVGFYIGDFEETRSARFAWEISKLLKDL